LTLTAIVYAPFAIASRPDHIGTKPILSIVALGVICTAIGFLVFFALIAEAGPTRSTVITYVNPAVAIIGGVAVLGEHLTTGMIIGFPLVLLGSALAASQAREPIAPEAGLPTAEPSAVSPG
jgi:drug/metabolite transporter (DMT)-like permease